jgi:16S rRNA processing protein RimM
LTLVSAGRVGRAHGYDGSFWVEDASHPLPLGTAVVLANQETEIERRAGTDQRPLLRLRGITDPRLHRGEPLLVDQELGAGEWLASELVGCEVTGLGRVRRVLTGPSCDVLELEDGTLVPLVSDAVVDLDADAGAISVDRRFLGLEDAEGAS